jgi:hypothetical protein
MMPAMDGDRPGAVRIVHVRKEVRMTSIIGAGIPSTVVPFGALAVVGGALAVALLVVTATVLIVADLGCGS